MIRGLLSVTASVLLFLSVFVFALSWDMSLSLTSDNVQEHGVNLAWQFLGLENQVSNITNSLSHQIALLDVYCKQNPNYTISYKGYQIKIPCEKVNLTSNASTVVNDTMKSLLSEIYYQNYTCGYWDCLNTPENSPMFLISEKSQKYWSGMAYTTFIISLLLIALLILLYPKKQSILFTTGTILILDALPLLAFQKIFSWFPAAVSEIGNIFFSQSNYVIIRMIALGATLLVAGLIVELFLAGFKIYNLFHRKEKQEEQKKEIKEEVLEEMEEKQKVSKASNPKKNQEKNSEKNKKPDKNIKNDNRRKKL